MAIRISYKKCIHSDCMRMSNCAEYHKATPIGIPISGPLPTSKYYKSLNWSLFVTSSLKHVNVNCTIQVL